MHTKIHQDIINFLEKPGIKLLPTDSSADTEFGLNKKELAIWQLFEVFDDQGKPYPTSQEICVSFEPSITTFRDGRVVVLYNKNKYTQEEFLRLIKLKSFI